jgi:2-hydroxy-6-oxonona-2,4-dienedioate hydrolase
MAVATVWRNEAGRIRLEAWYERFQQRIVSPMESRVVTTSYGPSHLLLAGPVSRPPLVCLHSMRTSSAHLLSELGPLLERFRIIAPDLPGQSVRGPQVRLSLTDDSLSRWFFEVLDGVGVEEVNLFGVSWGGFVARMAASADPSRIQRLALLVPAGIVNGSHWKGLTRMALPLVRYRLRRSESSLRLLLAPLLTTWDSGWAEFMGDSTEDMALDLRIPPLATDAELRALSMPTLVLGAEEDISFPGVPLAERVTKLIPDVDAEVIPDCKHCPPTTNEFRSWLADRITKFIDGGF